MQADPTAPPPLPSHAGAPPAPPPIDTAEWQPLPARGAWLYAPRFALAVAVPLTAAATALAAAAGLLGGPLRMAACAGLTGLVGLALGAWAGFRRHRLIGWKLDADGFASRRGNLWRIETLVPISRVQHLDLERGPLERKLGLATLVVHTAGTRMASVSVPLLDLEDAQRLRERLGRQLEQGDAL